MLHRLTFVNFFGARKRKIGEAECPCAPLTSHPLRTQRNARHFAYSKLILLFHRPLRTWKISCHTRHKKGHNAIPYLLHDETIPFARQKVTYCEAKPYVLPCLRRKGCCETPALAPKESGKQLAYKNLTTTIICFSTCKKQQRDKNKRAAPPSNQGGAARDYRPQDLAIKCTTGANGARHGRPKATEAEWADGLPPRDYSK